MNKKNKYNIADIQKFKNIKSPFTAITAYDFPTALIINELNIPIVLVGDSASMVVYGYDNTIPITIEEMLLVTKAVSRGINKALVVGDMPFMSYQPSNQKAVYNAGRLIKEGRVNAVKLEGGVEYLDRISKIIQAGIPVMGHIGLRPQEVLKESGYKIQGKTAIEALKIYKDAIALEGAGVFAMVLEGVPKELAKIITDTLKIPTIGIGAGKGCDGQIQVLHDVVGLFGNKVPRHAKVFSNSYKTIKGSIESYEKEVSNNTFPNNATSTKMDANELQALKKKIENI